MLTRATVLSTLLLSLSGWAVLEAQTPDAPQERVENVRVHGTVVDRETGEPLEGVSVQLESDELERDTDRVTNDEGEFTFQTVPSGVYRIRIVRIGYQSLDHMVQLISRTEVELDVELSSEAVALEPIVVETRRSTALAITGFYERQRRGFGRFVDRDDIEERNPFVVSDLFRTIPGVQVSSGSGRMGSEGILTMRGGCRPEVFVDGLRMIPPFPFDQVLGVQDVEAIEVYRGAETPAQYATTSGCGSVVVWTRRPTQGEAQPFSWKRFFVGVGFLAAGFALTR